MSLSGMVLGSDDQLLPIDSLEQTIGRNANGEVVTITVERNGGTYVQTLTRDGSGNVTAISGWVKQ